MTDEPIYFDVPAGKVRVPQFIGMSFPEAEDLAEELGLRLTGNDVSDDDRVIWVEGNWTVVEQSREAGLHVDEGARLEVGLLKDDESRDLVDAARAVDKHWNQQVFSGTVTGHATPEPAWDEPLTTIVVDDAVVELDLIWVYSVACWSAEEQDVRAAIALKEESLPIGTNVQVVRSQPLDERGFIHVLDGETGRPAPEPPTGSVNEALVRSGLWVPFGDVYNWSQVQAGLTSDYIASTGSADRRSTYAGIIAMAGTEIRSAGTGEVGRCANETIRILADQSAEAESRGQEQEANLRRVQALVESGAFNCRDGDGDGRCNER